MINFAVVKVGDKYNNDYVIRMKNAVKRHCRQPHKFHVFTDRPFSYDDCVVHRLPKLPIENSPLKGWWYKLYLFNQENGLSDKIFYIDLDCVIVGNLDRLIPAHNGFEICQDFNRNKNPNIDAINSSVMSWTPSPDTQRIWDQWHADSRRYVSELRGDQDYLQRYCKWIDFRYNNKNSILSYKWEVCANTHNRVKEFNLTPVLESDQHSIYVFHGKPDPHEVDHPVIKHNWR